MRKVWPHHLSTTVLALLVTCWFGVYGSADEEKADVAGTIKWAIYDGANSQLLSSGKRIVHKGDIDVSLLYKQIVKRIALEDHFILGLNDPVDCSKTSIEHGFALTGSRRDEKTFSWDWFVVDRPGHATKLQESGELSFDTTETRNGTEIDHIEFLTDVSIRLDRRTDSESCADSFKPAWRIKIFKGSSISWPVIPQRWPDGQARNQDQKRSPNV
jgi:hypothetical protein